MSATIASDPRLDAFAAHLARRITRILAASKPGQVVCLSCERAVPRAEWQRAERCPTCGWDRGFSLDS